MRRRSMRRWSWTRIMTSPDTVAFVNGVLGGFMRGEFPETAAETQD